MNIDQVERCAAIRSRMLFEPDAVTRFFASLLMRLEIVADTTVTSTMATNGKVIAIDPAWAAKQPAAEIRATILHEGLHVAYAHHLRFDDKRMTLPDHNVACDYVINLPLLEAGETLPGDAYVDEQFRGMSSEDVHDFLFGNKKKIGAPQDKPGNKPGNKPGQDGPGGRPCPDGPKGDKPGDGPKGHGDKPGGVLPYPGDVEEGQGALEVAVRQAVTIAAIGGNCPKVLKDIIKSFDAPPASGRDILERFARDCVSSTLSWRHPKRRYVSSGLYMPSRTQDDLSKIVVMIDTSGSINKDALHKFVSQCQGFLDTGMVETVAVIHTDTRVRHESEYGRGDIIGTKTYGGGGTDFRAAMELIHSKHDDAACVIVLTDLCLSQFGREPDCPVAWVKYGHYYMRQPPFGEVIPLT